MADLVTLIRADIERMRGRAARAAGDRGPLGNGGIMSYAGWHIAAVMHLDPAGAEQVLIDLLPEPEYLSTSRPRWRATSCQSRAFFQTFRYDLMWAAREGRTGRPGAHVRRRTQCRNQAPARAEPRRKPAGLKERKALAAIDAVPRQRCST